MSDTGPKLPAFVPLLAAYPVIYLATSNPGQIHWPVVAGVAAAVVAAALLLFFLLRLVARTTVGAGTATVLLVVMFFAYGQVSGWIDTIAIQLQLGTDQTPNVLDLMPHARLVIALIWAAAALGGAWYVARSNWAGKPELGKAMTFAAVALLVMAGVTSFSRTAGSSAAGPAAVSGGGSDGPGLVDGAPDVYFIVLDGYARQDVLARFYGFDNAPFLDQLRARGFRISDRSSSNYNWTFLSLASTLNLGYLHELFPVGIGPESPDVSLLYESIRNSLTSRFLRERGYKIVHIQSTWGATARNPYADREIRCEYSLYADEFVRAIVEATWLNAVHSKAGTDLARCHLANFDALGRIGAEPGPKFVFAHFVLPHHPYLFDRDGNVLRTAVVSNQFEFQKRLWEDRQSYLSQLEFVNGKVLEALDGILADSPRPPVVVIESDHGPTLIAGLSDEDQLAVRFATLGAHLLPGAPDDLLPADGSAVNQFRAILRHYFGADTLPVPDRHFLSPFSRPYAFRELPHEMLREFWTGMGRQSQAAERVNSKSTVGEQFDD